MRSFSNDCRINACGERAGFTLIEVLVSMTLLGIAVMGLAFLQSQQVRDQGANRYQIRLQQVLQEIVSKVSSSTASFPVINNASGIPMTYVGCFNDDGTPMARVGPAGTLTPSTEALSYVGVFVTAPPADQDQPFIATGNGAIQVCPLNQGGIEVHIYRPDGATYDLYRISVLVLPAPVTGAGARSFSTNTQGVFSSITL